MTDNQPLFEDICELLRFRLDEPPEKDNSSPYGFADILARVRSFGLQVTKSTTPDVYRAVQRVIASLHITFRPEVFVVNDPLANAFVAEFSHGVKPIIVLNSGIVTLLSVKELEFAIGHELGHFGLGHLHNLKVLNTRSEFEAMQNYSLQRYAEISADRIGLLAARSVFVAAHVIIKMASGLPPDALGFDIDAFVQQVEHDPEEVSRAWELDLSHPSLPFRLSALIKFSHSAEYSRLAGQGSEGVPLHQVDAEISDEFTKMGDGRLKEMEERVYQLALVWAGTALIMEDNLITPRGTTVLKQLVSPEYCEKAIAFSEMQGKDAVTTKLYEAIDRINSASLITRQRFMEAVKSFSISLNLSLAETHTGEAIIGKLLL